MKFAKCTASEMTICMFTAVMTAIATKHCHYDETVSVVLDGGILKIKIAPDNTVQMTGPAETIYEGETEIC